MCLSYDGHVAFYFLPKLLPLYPGKNLKAPQRADIIEHRRMNDGTKGKRIMKMQKMKPKILTCMKGYGAGQFKKDVTAGILVAVIAFPLMYRNARAAFEQIDVNLIHAARTLGMPEYKIFWKVAVPSAGPGLVAGTILTFARALGEYGATSMLAGNIPGKTGTISQRIAMVIQDGDYMTAGIWVVIIMLVAFVLIFLMNLVTGRNMKNIRRW